MQLVYADAREYREARYECKEVMDMQNKTLHMASLTLMVIGGLNWGLVGLFGLDLIDVVLGNWPLLARLVYVLVGVGTVVVLATHRNDCETCKGLAPHKSAVGPSGQTI